MQIDDVVQIRLFFEKTGRAKYISHLDTMRVFTRALERSRLPLWFTEGFNPHLYLTFALPLSLGCEGMCESFDTRLTQDIPLEQVSEKINSVLPQGFKIIKTALQKNKPTAITWADYSVELEYNTSNEAENISSHLEEFAKNEEINVSKKTKKGPKIINIAPDCSLLDINAQQNKLYLTIRLAAGNTLNINPSLYLNAFYEYSGVSPQLVRIKRIRLLDDKLNDFE